MKKTLIIIISIILSFFASLLFIETNSISSRSVEQQNSLLETEAEQIVFYSGNSNYDNDFFYLNKRQSFYSKNQKISSDILMVKENTIYTFIDYSKLKNNEVIISKNLCKLYGIKIGDKLSSHSAFSDEVSYYIVKDTIQPSYSISVDYFSDNSGLIILANNEDLANQLLESVIFVKNNDSLNSLTINKIISVSTLLTTLKRYSNRAIFLNLFALTLVVTITFALTQVCDSPLIRKDIILGFNKKRLLDRYAVPLFFYSLISYFVYMLVSSIFIYVSVGTFSFITVWLLGLEIPLLVFVVQYINILIKIRRS